MADKYGFVLQGDDEANTLETKVIAQGEDLDFYNIVHGAGGNDTISADSWMALEVGAELYGEDGNDTITGTDGINTLSGGAGDDAIYSQEVLDIIDGGDGTDTLHVTEKVGHYVTPKLGHSVTGIERLIISQALIIDDFDMNSIEEIGAEYGLDDVHLTFLHQVDMSGVSFVTRGGKSYDLSGSKFDDIFDVSHSRPKMAIHGRGGNDTILGGTGKTQLSGDAGDDILTGNVGADTISGGVGNDVINGGSAADYISGDSGNDTLNGGAGDDTISAGSGNDTIFAGKGNDTISGQEIEATDVKKFYGEAGNDRFSDFTSPNASRAYLDGGTGGDTLAFNGDANGLRILNIESLEVTGRTRHITASAEFLNSFKHITVQGGVVPIEISLSSAGNFAVKDSGLYGRIYGSNQNDMLNLSKSDNKWTVHGEKGADTILGGKGTDRIDGDEGNDIINGKGGNDEMTGGRGSDTFVFQAHSGRDIIRDFEDTSKAHDVIDLSAIKSIKDYDDLISHHLTIDGNVTIDLGGDDKIIVQGLSKADIAPDLFIF